MKTLKERLAQREVTVGSWITFSDPAVAEIMAGSGFDWLAIDMEHSGLSLNQAQELIRTIDLCGIPVLVRVSENNPDLIKRVMDMGAHGVIVPVVNSAEDALRAVNAVKYPPAGTRGVGLSRAQAYSLDFESYRDWNQANSIVIVQVEHVAAVENLEAIMAVEGVDGFVIGLYDLSGSLGCPGDFDDSRVQTALETIHQKSREHGYLIGQHVVKTEPEMVVSKIEEGVQFVGFGTDFLFLGEYCRQSVDRIKDSIR